MQKSAWYNKYIYGAIAKVWRWSPARREALKRAAGTAKGWYRCVECSDYRNPVHVDHIDPVVPVDRPLASWDEIIERRLGATVDNLQVLCTEHHKEKTKNESGLRAKWRKKKNKKK